MASKKKPANFKVTKSKNEIMTAVLIGLVTTLIVIVIGVILLHTNQTSDKTSQTVEKVDNGSVNLGSLGFRIEGDKAVIRNDSATQELRDFLKADVKKSGCKGNNGVTAVIAHSQDEKQLLLGYGCGNSAARMFAVKQDSGWKVISPTNQFNLFDIPSCKMVDENNISNEIAPVCQNEKKVGDNLSYDYKIR
ncbi:hypothetical protein EUA69_02010 [TM7 phylum sp. oral taxon 352]|nr:hypothetical protein EUA74_00375 [TM7 phylum sp. oral taxon 352]TWP16804.1 hypothetical protein EUA69_02010 [TM7 phylum sp. oral taxon 352]TWP18911.1 hypothetical protein EUA71_00770 [TM7 phylum sp. oral taxon 352]